PLTNIRERQVAVVVEGDAPEGQLREEGKLPPPGSPGERRPDPLPRIRVHYVPQMTGGGEHVLVAVQVHVQEQHVPRPGRGLDACVGRDLLECRSEEPRLNSSHEWISYAVFCLNKKN